MRDWGQLTRGKGDVMIRRSGFALALGLWIAATGAARADFSACGSALQATDPHQQIELYTICLTKGGIASGDRAGAYNNRGVAYLGLGEEDQALADFSAAIENDPKWNTSYLNRARIYLSRRQLDMARADLDRALKLTPGSNWTEALLLRARVYLAQKDPQAARADLDKAVSKGRPSPDVYAEAAWLLATSPDPSFRDGPRAVELAREAVRRRDLARFHDTLALALAAAGRFEEAAAEEGRAMDLAQTQGGDISAMAERQARYRNGQGPWGPSPAP
jgi:tetratricopeptide (TPR) repeat protein